MNPYVEILCPQCRRDLRVRTEYLGQRVRCKYCEHAWTVPPGEVLSRTAIVGWSWPGASGPSDPARGRLTRLGEYVLLEEVSRSGMTAVYRASHDPDGCMVNLMLEGRVVADPPVPGAGGTAIPGYDQLETIREGAMGRVLKARQVVLDRVVAIKIMRSALARNPEYRERFRREARIAAKLANHHFIQTIDAGEVAGRPYYVMEYVAGETLESHLARHTTLQERAAVTIALGLAEAIRHAHQTGIVHRDIKPANVILAESGGIKLADLGLARAVADEEWAAAEAGMAVGTPDYISPEQIRGQVDVDVRSDIYSLGATLYRMVTGRLPFDGQTNREVMSKHLAKDRPLVPPDQLNPQISPALSALIQKMMSRNRDDRHRVPDDLIFDLRGLLAGSPLLSDVAPPAGPLAIDP